MRIWRCAALICAVTFLSGCLGDTKTVPINLDFAHTNYGYINSGDYKAGSFFHWNKTQETLSYLTDIPGFDAPANPRDRSRDFASYSSGVELGTGFQNPAMEVRANALIASKSSFEISYPNRVLYDRVYSRISAYLTADIESEGDLLSEWGFKDAAKDPEQYYILVRDVTYGDSITLLVDGEAKAGGSFSIPLKGYDVDIELKGRGLQDIQGTDTEVAFAVYVLRPYWKQENGQQTPAFEVVRGLDVSQLPSLLRNVGKTS